MNIKHNKVPIRDDISDRYFLLLEHLRLAHVYPRRDPDELDKIIQQHSVDRCEDVCFGQCCDYMYLTQIVWGLLTYFEAHPEAIHETDDGTED